MSETGKASILCRARVRHTRLTKVNLCRGFLILRNPIKDAWGLDQLETLLVFRGA